MSSEKYTKICVDLKQRGKSLWMERFTEHYWCFFKCWIYIQAILKPKSITNEPLRRSRNVATWKSTQIVSFKMYLTKIFLFWYLMEPDKLQAWVLTSDVFERGFVCKRREAFVYIHFNFDASWILLKVRVFTPIAWRQKK